MSPILLSEAYFQESILKTAAPFLANSGEVIVKLIVKVLLLLQSGGKSKITVTHRMILRINETIL